MKDPVWVPCVVIKEFEGFTRVGTRGVCNKRDMGSKQYPYEFKYNKDLLVSCYLPGHVGDYNNLAETSYYFPKECLQLDSLSIRLSLL